MSFPFPLPFPGPAGGAALLPSLDLNFLSGTFDGRVTFARASSATEYDNTGARQTVGNDVPRLSFDPITHLLSGLLIEEQRVNELKNSGTPATQTTVSLSANTYCLWVEGTGSATSSAGTATGTGFGAATAGSPNVFTLTAAGTVVVTVSGALTDFQLENGPFPTSYIATAGAPVTRIKDQASVPVSSWFNSSASTMVVEAMLPAGPVNTVIQYLAEISDGTNNNRFQFERATTSNNLSALYQINGGTAVFNQTVGVITPGSVFKTGVAASAAGVISAFNGAAGPNTSSAPSGPLPATALFIGQHGNLTSQTDGFIRRVRYWPRALSQNELNQATT